VQVHEQFHRGTLGALAAEVKAEPLKGELTVVVEGSDTSEAASSAVDDTALQEHLQELISAGVPPSQAARMVSRLLHLPKGQMYDMAVRIAAQRE
jgi:16S rRNA C1402 (ribose-2'-O) methylase RsmI